jgi:hypothetical protein
MNKKTTTGRTSRGARTGPNSHLWRCSNCGRRFVTRNMWHSCSNHSLDSHFRGCQPAVRDVFDHTLRFLRSLGPVTVIPQATRISFQARVRFATAVVRRKWLECGVWLKRKVDDSSFRRVDHYGRNDWVYRYRLSVPSDLTESLRSYLAEAYEVGRNRPVVPRRRQKGARR